MQAAQNTPQAAPAQDVITPAEAKFWLEAAGKAPALIRDQLGVVPDVPNKPTGTPIRIFGFTIGATLAAATCYIPGKWKILSGGASVVAAGAGMYLGALRDVDYTLATDSMRHVKQKYLNYANALERSPELQAQLGNYFGAQMTGDFIESRSIEDAVKQKAVEFGLQTPYLQNALPAPARTR